VVEDSCSSSLLEWAAVARQLDLGPMGGGRRKAQHSASQERLDAIVQDVVKVN
jgi:hypothetical protein